MVFFTASVTAIITRIKDIDRIGKLIRFPEDIGISADLVIGSILRSLPLMWQNMNVEVRDSSFILAGNTREIGTFTPFGRSIRIKKARCSRNVALSLKTFMPR